MFDTTGLLPPQMPHAQRLLNSLYLNGVAVDLSMTGCGKTYVASKICQVLKTPSIVIGPKSILNTWKRVMSGFGVTPKLTINYEKICRGNTEWLLYPNKIPNAEGKMVELLKEDRYLNTVLKLPKGSTVILEESHKCKGVTSLQAGLMMAIKRYGYRTLMLSATQAASPLDMRAFGYTTNLHDGTMKHWKMFNEDCGAEWKGRWGAQTFDSESETAKTKMKWCHDNLFNLQGIASRLTHDDMGDYLPENQVVAEPYDMGNASTHIQAIYDELELAIARWQESTDEYKSGHVLAEITKARRLIELQKVPVMAEMIGDLYDEGRSVVCFVNYTESVELLSTILNLDKRFAGKNLIGYIYGGATDKNRERDEQDFQANKKRIIVANLASGGTALSFHDLDGKYPRASIINPSFSAIALLQALGRIHRAEGKSKCYQRLLYAGGVAVEERICYRVQTKLNGISMLNDGDLVDGMKFFNFFMGRVI
jgi:hypothetical protein